MMVLFTKKTGSNKTHGVNDEVLIKKFLFYKQPNVLRLWFTPRGERMYDKESVVTQDFPTTQKICTLQITFPGLRVSLSTSLSESA